MILLRRSSAQTDAFCHSSLYESVGYADTIGQGERLGDEADRVWHCLICRCNGGITGYMYYMGDPYFDLKIAAARRRPLGDAPDNLIRLSVREAEILCWCRWPPESLCACRAAIAAHMHLSILRSHNHTHIPQISPADVKNPHPLFTGESHAGPECQSTPNYKDG